MIVREKPTPWEVFFVIRGSVIRRILPAMAAVAGLLQLIAGVALGLASPEALHRAAREGPRATILVVLALAGCGLLAWLLRQRPAAAAGLGLAGPLLAGLVVWKGGLSKLGLAYHGEFILHHFLALVCAALCLAIGSDLRTLAAWSNLAGGLVCEQVGVVPIDRMALLSECEELDQR